MKIISHRQNTLQQLKLLPRHYGVEVDIRSYGNKLIVQHDPFMDGESFNSWLAEYRHGTLILNVKEEGLEEKLTTIMKERAIEDYFLLDQSFPYLVKWANNGFRRSAVRVSEYESIETAMTLAGKVDWVWVDCFTKFPLDKQTCDRLIQAGFKLCLVSPELQGRDAETKIPELIATLKKLEIIAHAVCTKRSDVWEKNL